MKTIGLIGGMSWESTALYYRIINRAVGERLGALHSARLLLLSVDFEDVVQGQRRGDWDGLGAQLAGAARRLQDAGADCVLIGTNTMHRVADAVRDAVDVPLLHIADATAAAIGRAGCRRVALLGTRYTMEQPFYVAHLARQGIDCVVPHDDDRELVHRLIFDELCRGVVAPSARARLQGVVARQLARGVDGVVLGCTELPLALQAADVAAPLFDTTELHALAAVDFALRGVPALDSLPVSMAS